MITYDFSGAATSVFHPIRQQETVSPNTLWFFADDVDKIYEEFVQASVKITEDIETKPWRIRQFTIEDLDGNRLIFHHDI